MLIVVNSKKTLLVTSIGLCFIGSFIAALKLFYSSRKKPKEIKGSRPKSATKSAKTRPEISRVPRISTSSANNKIRTERSVLMDSVAHQEEINNLPAEELLELGMNYLNQAIKSWETAVDSIESAAYMQSQTLALPVSLI
jgi:hypothetical protein